MSKLVYIIRKGHRYENIYNDSTELFDCQKFEYYEVLRKISILGLFSFLYHFDYPYEFEKLETARSYIIGWHKANYGDKYDIEIIEQLEDNDKGINIEII